MLRGHLLSHQQLGKLENAVDGDGHNSDSDYGRHFNRQSFHGGSVFGGSPDDGQVYSGAGQRGKHGGAAGERGGDFAVHGHGGGRGRGAGAADQATENSSGQHAVVAKVLGEQGSDDLDRDEKHPKPEYF